MNIIGRNKEIKELDCIYKSGKPEFIALYGRRRVGKTFLVDQKYGDEFAFKVTGIIDGSRQEQMSTFVQAMREIGYQGDLPASWLDAFFQLQELLKKRLEKKKRCIIFIDELPCFDTQKSGFIKALGHFWNNWCSIHPEIMLIVCGSATTWMIKNLIDSHGGLHNRITHEFHICPFTLFETEKYLEAKNILWDRLSILQIYMALGGIPYYFDLLQNGESAALSIDRLFFAPDAKLRNEFKRLFSSLFRNPEGHLSIINALCQKKSGMTRDEIAEKLKTPNNGHLSKILEDLIQCDFVRYYRTRGNKIKKTNGVYQLVDFFTIFHKHFAEKTTDAHYWSHHLNTPAVNSWMGLAFERLCYSHIDQIKKALGIDKIATEYYCWRYNDGDNGAQIDLIIERADRVFNVCEIKYSEYEYSLQKGEYLNIRNRVGTFQQEVAKKSSVVPTLITTIGLKQNSYASAIPVAVVLDDLFSDL